MDALTTLILAIAVLATADVAAVRLERDGRRKGRRSGR
jgi:hypothetical protein